MSSFVFSENDPFSPIKYCYSMDKLIYSHRGRFGDVAVTEHEYFGRMLVLDGVVQLTERDEHYYHEMLAHVPLHAHPGPETVLIIGGGDGGTLREVLKHKSVQRAVMCEIDQEVIETSKRYLPTLSSGFADSRVTINIADGADFVARSRQQFDVILVDSTDPVGPAQSLFTEKFFSDAREALKQDGLFVAQTESLHFHLHFVREVQDRLRQVFPMADVYTVPLATYAGNWWTFSIASKTHNPRQPLRKCEVPVKYYAEDVHGSSFLPPSVYQRMLRQ